MEQDRFRTLAVHRTWRWRLDPADPDHYLGVETTDEGFRFFAWSHLHGEDGLTGEALQSFAEFETDGPLWTLPDDVERQLRAWLASQRNR